MKNLSNKLLFVPVISARLVLAVITISCNANRISYLEFMGNDCASRQIVRKYINSNIFIEKTRLVMKNGNQSIYTDTFEVKNNVWRIYCCGEWHKYFDKNGCYTTNVWKNDAGFQQVAFLEAIFSGYFLTLNEKLVSSTC